MCIKSYYWPSTRQNELLAYNYHRFISYMYIHLESTKCSKFWMYSDSFSIIIPQIFFDIHGNNFFNELTFVHCSGLVWRYHVPTKLPVLCWIQNTKHETSDWCNDLHWEFAISGFPRSIWAASECWYHVR